MNVRVVKNSDIQGLKKVKEDLTNEQIEQRLRWQEEGKARWLVMVDKKQPIGYVVLKWFGKPTAPEYPDLEDLYVHPDHRGKGVAGQLVEAAETLVRQGGYTKLGMAVNPDPRCPAHKLYAKLGYQIVNGHKYVDGTYNNQKDWVIDMVKEL